MTSSHTRELIPDSTQYPIHVPAREKSTRTNGGGELLPQVLSAQVVWNYVQRASWNDSRSDV